LNGAVFGMPEKPMRQRSHTSVITALVVVLIGLTTLTSEPESSTATGRVERLTFATTTPYNLTTTVELTFDTPTDTHLATAIQQDLIREPLLQAQAPQVERLPCQTHIVRLDRNGTINLQYSCFPAYAAVAWSFRLSPRVQATVVGQVHERGLEWWQNSTWRHRGAPHVIPPDYLLHGTIVPVWNGDIIDYQDLLSWRHNIGPGGRIAVAFAGSVRLG
jgi:hypothetical protein